jgi:hypothetical protein
MVRMLMPGIRMIRFHANRMKREEAMGTIGSVEEER